MYRQSTAGKAFTKCATCHFQQRDEIQRCFLVGQRAFIGHGELMQIVHQLGERTDFSLQRGNGVRGELAYAILNGLQFTAQHR